ncbi:hypothetical protein [Pseudodesulfovibrio portus]|jgi:hypothetical protein|uniref:Uncharacterized protein n=1 Tax=Pseudodesulfovibrio portus TaxID=231439 RepID=A0ABM8ATP7_9BACT|nr:hypothetical protein [Pseudodesulfovibrio portus]BDQ34900.1 hypothetical protein JCM14722_24420 [Pseudodesulfovibrio portus]
MVKQGSRANRYSKVSLLAVILFLLAGFGLVYFKTDLLHVVAEKPEGVSGLVSVRGAVSLEQLHFSQQEIQAINNVVNSHRKTFTKVDMIVDAVGHVDEIKDDTVLVFAVSLKTSGNLEVKSWSRKLERKLLVAQFVDYLRKAATEYEEFQKFPDVKKNFKTLYI